MRWWAVLAVGMVLFTSTVIAHADVPPPGYLPPLPECSLRCQIISFFLEKPFLVVSISPEAQRFMDEQGIELKDGGVFFHKALRGFYYLSDDQLLQQPELVQNAQVGMRMANGTLTMTTWNVRGEREVLRWNGRNDFKKVEQCSWRCQMDGFIDALKNSLQPSPQQ